MHAQNFLFDDPRNWHTVEDSSKSLPQPDRIPPLALVEKSINAIDCGTLVVAAKEPEVVRPLYLNREKESDRFHGLICPINVLECWKNSKKMSMSNEQAAIRR